MSIRNKIVPIPRNFKYLNSENIVLGYSGTCFCTVKIDETAKDDLSQNALNLVRAKLKGILNAPIPCDGKVTLTLGMGDVPENISNAQQGYIIKALDNNIEIKGFGPEGLYYGVISFIRLLEIKDNVLKLPCFEIMDWPDMKTRGHFMESRYGSNLMTLEDWKAVVDDMALMKMNQLVVSVYGCWCVQYDNRVSEYLYIPVEQYPKLKTPVVKKYYSVEKKSWINEEQLPPMF